MYQLLTTDQDTGHLPVVDMRKELFGGLPSNFQSTFQSSCREVEEGSRIYPLPSLSLSLASRHCCLWCSPRMIVLIRIIFFDSFYGSKPSRIVRLAHLSSIG